MSTSHIQINRIHPSPNKTFCAPSSSEYSPQKDSTDYCGANMVAINQPSPVSNLIPTNQVDTDVNNDYDSQYYSTPRKHDHTDT